jgi:fluoride exporter
MMWIALGGGIGAICRWLVAEAFPARDGKFPLGTFLVNMTGCFIMGLYLGWVHDRLPVAWMMANRPFVAGFLGGYTTFSTFSYEAERLRQQKRKGKFWAYLLSSLFLGLFLVWSGFHISSGMVS